MLSINNNLIYNIHNHIFHFHNHINYFNNTASMHIVIHFSKSCSSQLSIIPNSILLFMHNMRLSRMQWGKLCRDSNIN